MKNPGKANIPGLHERSLEAFAALERDLRQRLDALQKQRDRLERLRERLKPPISSAKPGPIGSRTICPVRSRSMVHHDRGTG